MHAYSLSSSSRKERRIRSSRSLSVLYWVGGQSEAWELVKKNKKINNNKKPKSLIINFKIWDLENIHWMLARNFCVLNDSRSIHSFIFVVSYSFSFLFFLSPSCSISSPLLPLFLSVIKLYFLHASPSQPKNRMLWYLTSLSKLLLLTYNVLNKY